MTIEVKRRAMETIKIIRPRCGTVRAACKEVAAQLGVSWQSVEQWWYKNERGKL